MNIIVQSLHPLCLTHTPSHTHTSPALSDSGPVPGPQGQPLGLRAPAGLWRPALSWVRRPAGPIPWQPQRGLGAARPLLLPLRPLTRPGAVREACAVGSSLCSDTTASHPSLHSASLSVSSLRHLRKLNSHGHISPCARRAMPPGLLAPNWTQGTRAPRAALSSSVSANCPGAQPQPKRPQARASTADLSKSVRTSRLAVPVIPQLAPSLGRPGFPGSIPPASRWAVSPRVTRMIG